MPSSLLRRALHRIHPQAPQWAAMQAYRVQARRDIGPWAWRPGVPCPTARLDASGVQIGPSLFVIAGFRPNGTVLSAIDVLDLRSGEWTRRIAMPEDLAQSHLGFATDGARFVYLVTGQLGDHCRGAVRTGYVLDVLTDAWTPLPPLPAARYAPAMQLWNGRLHVMGGSAEDRFTPADDHWSLGVSGAHHEPKWRSERPIPRGGCHRACVVLQGRLYVFGGQEGDFVADPNDPDCRCSGDFTHEVYIPDTFCLPHPDAAWERRADLPLPVSHAEAAVVKQGNRILLFGGQVHKSLHTRRLTLTDAIQAYDASTDRWRLVGRLPYRIKNTVVGEWKGRVTVTVGQRDTGPNEPQPGTITDQTWRSRLPR